MIFLTSVCFAAALVFYLPGVFTHTDTDGKKQKGNSPEYFKIFPKNTIFNEHPVIHFLLIVLLIVAHRCKFFDALKHKMLIKGPDIINSQNLIIDLGPNMKII